MATPAAKTTAMARAIQSTTTGGQSRGGRSASTWAVVGI